MKLGVCVPYRDRELHLNEFIPKVGKYLKNQDIDFHMYFCHQTDDKLFNRGATKNIAAKHAFEDGCDYIVWHDIDMIPEEDGGADYTFPKDKPRHIATKIEQMSWQLKYHEYFGGAVLFSKEHVEKTNGYSNEYWDWGMEDDDLFWRCHKEGLTENTYLDLELKNHKYYYFSGENSKITIPFKRHFKDLFSNSHTISMLVRPQQQIEKNPIFLIGDKTRKYVEYPIFTIPGYDYSLSFNNSRALALTFWNTFNAHNYMWIKRYDNQWSWITAVFDTKKQLAHFYINGSEVDARAGIGSHSPWKWEAKLKRYDDSDFYLGHSPSIKGSNRNFKGDIANLYVWDVPLTQEQVSNIHKKIDNENLVIKIDPNKNFLYNDKHNKEGIETKTEDIKIPNSILPHRVDGRLRCLPHKDEGIVNGGFAKGETTARNERRYVLEMQQGKINYKLDGIKQVKYELVSEEKLTPFATMINIKL